MPRQRVLVLMGGPSTEHDVSVVSGTGMVRALDSKRYNVHPVLVSKDQWWTWSERELSAYQKDNFSANYFQQVEGTAAHKEHAPSLDRLPKADIALLAFHGQWGEDGCVQALLEHWGIPYTGSGVLGSALAMDKIQSKLAYRAMGVPTPDFEILNRDTFSGDRLAAAADRLGFPLVIKDPCGGSSIGMGIVKDLDAAGALVTELFQVAPRLLVEKFVRGRETSCGYVEGFATPVPPTEIVMTSQEFFNFEAKYKGESREVTPPDLPAQTNAAIQDVARRAHEALSCQVYSRTDVLVEADTGALYALETNTLPGFTPQSLLPQQAAAVGVSYSHLLDHLIERSLIRFGRNPRQADYPKNVGEDH